MAHWTATLDAAWWSRRTSGADTNYVQWEPPQGSRPRIVGGILADPDNDERFLSRLVLDGTSNLRAVVHITALQTGGIIGGTQDLSDGWETNHRMKVTVGDASWELPVNVADDLSEHYIYESSVSAEVDAFQTFLQSMTAQVEAELILWDGQGADPFNPPPDHHAKILLPAAQRYELFGDGDGGLSRLTWGWDAGSGPTIPGDLMADGADGELRELAIRHDGSSSFLDLDISGSATRDDLSDEVEEDGQITLIYAGTNIHVADLSGDGSDSYSWAAPDIQGMFRAALAGPNTYTAGAAVLEIWNGQGDDPFAHAAGIFVGGNREARRYIGDRRVQAVYLGENKL